MAGTPIQTFNDFMNATGPTYLTSADAVINEAVKNTYAFSRLLKEKTSEATVQGGNEIRDVIMFDDASTYDHYLPNDTFNWQNAQVLDTIKCPWRFSIDHMAWTDHEVELNAGEGASRDYVKAQYKRLKRSKEQRMWTSLLNGFENDLWRTPFGNSGEMEAASGKLPYSLPAFISELPDFNNAFGVRGGMPLGWSSVLGLANNSTNSITSGEDRWTNQISYYTNHTISGAAVDPNLPMRNVTVENVRVEDQTVSVGIGGLITAFDDMFLKCDFQPPATRQEYFEKPSLNRQMILCSRNGINLYKRALRASNDTLVSYQDAAYNAPAYSGIELMYCANLDTAPIYPALSSGSTQRTVASYTSGDSASDVAIASTTTGASEFQTGTGGVIDPGPRFWWVNGNYLTPIYHARRYFEKHEVLRHPNQPFTYVQVVDCWWNLFCNSRQRHGIVAPLQLIAST
jgi:hypothetical protein